MNYRYALRCIECGKEYSPKEVRYVCPDCQKKQKPFDTLRGVLEVKLDEKYIDTEDRKNLNQLSAFRKEDILDYPVGNTPLIYSKNLNKAYDFEKVYIKDDGKNPTNSLKDRASLLVVSEALLKGENEIVTASTGNAASSLAGVCAYAGCKAIIFVPAKAPFGKLVQTAKYGAVIIPVDGTYDDAFELSFQYSQRTGACNRNTAYNPMTTEGKKTVALEIYKDLNYQVPDTILVPVGDGSIISGVMKGFKDLKRFGYTDKLPRLIAVQSEGSDSISRGYENGIPPLLKETKTCADSICVNAPRNGIRAIKDIKESAGFCVKVSDDDILEAQSIQGRLTGIFAEPAASSSMAGFIKISNKLDKDKINIILSTGDGLKDIKTASRNINIPEPISPDIDKVLSYLNKLRK